MSPEMMHEMSVSSVGMPMADRRAPPATIVIFGAAGDLTKRLIMPALYNLVHADRLADRFHIVGVGHNDLTTESWREGISDTLQSFIRDRSGEFHPREIDPKDWNWLAERMSFLRGDFSDPET